MAKLAKERGTTRAAISMEKAREIDKPVIFAIGNAPTALVQIYEMMKTARQFCKRSRHWIMMIGVLITGISALLSCSEYDLDERTPEGWGSSIYSWLEEQGSSGGESFKVTVRLIDDLGYREVLAKTGSKTIFVADDAAYEQFFRNNPWGVKSYEQLSTSQKKLLLFGSMIDNSMQLNSLSSVEGTPPREG